MEDHVEVVQFAVQVTTHRELVRDGGGGAVDVAALPQHPSTLVQQLQQVFHVQHLQQAPPSLWSTARLINYLSDYLRAHQQML